MTEQNAVTSEGKSAIESWMYCQGQVSLAQRRVAQAQGTLAGATRILAKWMLPDDAQVGEKIAVWFGDSLIQVEVRPNGEDPDITIRKRGKTDAIEQSEAQKDQAEMKQKDTVDEVQVLKAEVSRLKQEIVWGFYEEKDPIYVQGPSGQHEMTSEITAEEANGMVARINDLSNALGLALLLLGKNETGDWMTTSNEFVAMTMHLSTIANEESRDIISAAIEKEQKDADAKELETERVGTGELGSDLQAPGVAFPGNEGV